MGNAHFLRQKKEEICEDSGYCRDKWTIYVIIYIYIYWLVVLTILKNIKVNGKDDIPYSMENKRCLKPPTSIISIYIYIYHHIYIYIYSNENWKGKTTWFGFGTWESERIPRNPCRVFEMFPMKITICWVFGIPHFRSFQMCPLEKEVQFSLSTQV